ncbi:DUF1697 domain-containing protein [Aquabacter sp. CN5-332]|uniref:DUF1697 domain-containing protein n=1 Tax=Aquabacter sp. CN5-332 TaxID=3156608 RepID=UPI0032B4866A
MSKRVALLRGVNVGGKTMVSMAELRHALEALDLADVSTLLQSGNVLFEAGGAGNAALETRIAGAVSERFGLETEVFVHDAGTWGKLIKSNPMTAAAEAAPSGFIMLVLKAPAEAKVLEKLQALAVDGEELKAVGHALFASLPNGIGRSKLGNALSGKMAGLRGTGRNWNTVLKIAALLEA